MCANRVGIALSNMMGWVFFLRIPLPAAPSLRGQLGGECPHKVVNYRLLSPLENEAVPLIEGAPPNIK